MATVQWQFAELVGGRVDITILYGVDWELVFSGTGVPDLAGATIEASVRQTFDASASLVDFTATVLTTGASTSSFSLSLTSAETAALAPASPVESGATRAVACYGEWDVVVRPAVGPSVRLTDGRATLRQGATQ